MRIVLTAALSVLAAAGAAPGATAIGAERATRSTAGQFAPGDELVAQNRPVEPGPWRENPLRNFSLPDRRPPERAATYEQPATRADREPAADAPPASAPLRRRLSKSGVVRPTRQARWMDEEPGVQTASGEDQPDNIDLLFPQSKKRAAESTPSEPSPADAAPIDALPETDDQPRAGARRRLSESSDSQPLEGVPADDTFDLRDRSSPTRDTRATPPGNGGQRPIGALSANITVPGNPRQVPEDYAQAVFASRGEMDYAHGGRGWNIGTYHWTATSLCYAPLYFEEINVERYGYTNGLFQPVVSAARFYGEMPLLPYLLWAEPPCECIYTLGHYRPGSLVPYQLEYPPLRTDASLFEWGCAIGAVLIIP